MVVLVQYALVYQLRYALMREIRMYGTHAEAQQRSHMMDVSGLARLQHDGYLRALLCAHEMLLHGGYRQQRGYGHMVLVHAPVGEDDDIAAPGCGAVYGYIQLLQGSLQRGVFVVEQRYRLSMEARPVQRLDLHDIHTREDGIIDLKHATVLRLFIEQIAVRADIYGRIGHDLLTQRVDGRVRDLREQLLEVVEQRLVLAREHGKRRIMPHGSRRLGCIFRHGQYAAAHVLIGIAKYLVELVSEHLIVRRYLPVRDAQLL